jgi:hypothetical protein
MEIIYSATTSAWVGITYYEGKFCVVDDSYEYVNIFSSSVIFTGTYEECRKYVDVWYRFTAITW